MERSVDRGLSSGRADTHRGELTAGDPGVARFRASLAESGLKINPGAESRGRGMEHRRLTAMRASTCESAFWAHDVQDPVI